MNIFDLRNNIVKDYSSYVKSFINILDGRISSKVYEEFSDGLLWPDPLIQLSPAFESGGTIEELVGQGILHKECLNIFKINKTKEGGGNPLRLYKHQLEAIHAAKSGDNYVLTTGTGSGKSLAYLIPIVDYVLNHGSGDGIKAIIVYPMNALANSQYGELQKFLCHGYPDGNSPVTFERYTGQEDENKRENIISNPPDILLTNYVMLELILTRPIEKRLINAAQGLKFLVLDELHTYRGRQGSDVSMLIRRLKNVCRADELQYIGTSATVVSTDTFEDQQVQVASVASVLFGSKVKPQRVIGESLKRITKEHSLEDKQFLDKLKNTIENWPDTKPNSYEEIISNPLARWVETNLGITRDRSGRFVRVTPRPIRGPNGVAKELSNKLNLSEELCAKAIEDILIQGSNIENPETGSVVFAFRIHQFISKGDTVYASPEYEDNRYITLSCQQFVPDNRNKILFPLVFCRECGQEYFCVWKIKDPDTGKIYFKPRNPDDRFSEPYEPGYLYIRKDFPWPDDIEKILTRVPEDWIEKERNIIKIKPSKKKNLPEKFYITPDGKTNNGSNKDETLAFFVTQPFCLCLRCKISYSSSGKSDFPKLATLGTEGRSSATTILSLSIIKNLRKTHLFSPKAKKLLSFTDNRQDASLQAGHFNDFVQVGLIRSALYNALKKAGTSGITHEEITHKVFEELDIPPKYYSTDPNAKFSKKQRIDRTLREVLGYHIYRDLRRGWRVVIPNLEQCGLLKIEYLDLDEVCSAKELWEKHPLLEEASVDTRKYIAKTLLDFMRRRLAIKINYLDRDYQDKLKSLSEQYLKEPWALDREEELIYSAYMFPRARQKKEDTGQNIYLSGRSLFGQFLRRRGVLTSSDKLTLEDVEEIIKGLIFALEQGGLIEPTLSPPKNNDIPGYQIPASSFVWKAGDGKIPFYDDLKLSVPSNIKSRPNPYFVEFYKKGVDFLKGLEAREHTAQVSSEERKDREKKFRKGELPVLYCSPTMELGVDISQLNVVLMRNVPPTPANYAQRSGRAGRSGEPALIVTYCAAGNSHDQYFFKRPHLMVAGAVSPPRLDLTNEDLIRSHVQAIWLAESEMDLGKSLRDILDLSGQEPSLKLLDRIEDTLQSSSIRKKAYARSIEVLNTVEDIKNAPWYSKEWLKNVIDNIPREFDRCCERWRELYRAALEQKKIHDKIISDATRTSEERKEARRLRNEAETQMELLLRADNTLQSDFYSYRYFACEGFLPGYNFPRLPISAYIPGKRKYRGRDEFVSRPRFLAISEFGPHSVIYHEGSRYSITKAILSISPEREMATTSIKLCPACGYIHKINIGQGVDRCEYCSNMLDFSIKSLIRLQNVSTKRKQKITSDEEERLRLGYKLKTGFRFVLKHGELSCEIAEIKSKDNNMLIGHLVYGHSANIWRINMGWLNSKYNGFLLDIETGFWKGDRYSSEDLTDTGKTIKKVIPYVEDHKNCLIFSPTISLNLNQMASLQAALKTAIQVQYQLEENELAVEPLPDESNRKIMLFYEASEGGAGVLKRILHEKDSFSKIAKLALEICHFDPENGKDLEYAPNSKEKCEAACYDCLMNYGNQRDHHLLDRKSILDMLLTLAKSEVITGSSSISRDEHLKKLLRCVDSELEEKWLLFLEEKK